MGAISGVVGGFYAGSAYPGGYAAFEAEAEAITGIGAVTFAVPALAGVALTDVTTGGGVSPPEVHIRRPRPRVRALAITGRGALRISGPDVSGTAALAITGTGSIELEPAALTGVGAFIAGEGSVVLAVGGGGGTGLVSTDAIDRAWAELQRKDEDDLMVMLLEIV